MPPLRSARPDDFVRAVRRGEWFAERLQHIIGMGEANLLEPQLTRRSTGRERWPEFTS
jgi:hypothetical protein